MNNLLIDCASEPVYPVDKNKEYYLREVVHDMHYSMNEKLKYAKSRKRTTEESPLEKSRSEAQMIKNAVLKKTYAPISVMQEIIANNNSKQRTTLMSITPLIQRRFDLPIETVDFIDATIREAMNAMAVFRLEDGELPPPPDDD